jgi:ribosome-binding factor A
MGRRTRGDSGATAGQRPLRVGEAIRHALAAMLAEGRVRDPALDGVSLTVTEARASPDLRNVLVFVVPLGGAGGAEAVAALARAAPYLRGEVARAVRLKFAPTLRFALDRSFDASDRVAALLGDPRVARDLDRPLPARPPRRPDKSGGDDG